MYTAHSSPSPLPLSLSSLVLLFSLSIWLSLALKALLKVLYVTEGKGMVTGVLEANCDYVRFMPDPGLVVDEYGEAEFTLHFEHTDLLQPISQHEVPDTMTDQLVDVGA